MAFIAGAAAFFFTVTLCPPVAARRMAAGFLALAAILAAYWPLSNNFSTHPGKMPWIAWLGRQINASFPQLPGLGLNANVIAGTLLVSVPFGIALSWQWLQQRRRVEAGMGVFLTLIILFSLLLTDSRGAWAGLAGATLLAGLVMIQRRRFGDSRSRLLFWSLTILTFLLGLAGLSAAGRLEGLIGYLPDPGMVMRPRADLWREGLALAQDYWLTGSGLASFGMVHSAYAIMTHVPFISETHNSFLQVWIEQGLLGAIALIWGTAVVIGWAWKNLARAEVPGLAWAGLAAVFAAGVQGSVEVVFFDEPTLPVFGLVLGFAALRNFPAEIEPPSDNSSLAKRLSLRVYLALLLLVIMTAGVFRRPLTAGLFANIAALEQTRVELSQYDPDHYTKLTLDQIRRQSDLSIAKAYFLKALAIQPQHPTALKRLSLIALSTGEHRQALVWADTAWQSGQHDFTTRLLLGDALVANGRPEEAARLLKDVSWASNRLAGIGWMRYWVSGDIARAATAWQTALLLDPQNTDAAAWLEKAQSQLETSENLY